MLRTASEGGLAPDADAYNCAYAWSKEAVALSEKVPSATLTSHPDHTGAACHERRAADKSCTVVSVACAAL